MQSPLRRITVTTEEGKSLSPSISGDGRIIAFESTEDIANAGGPDSFRAIRANVSVDSATFLQMAATRAPAPAISQDGSRIAFAAKENPLGTNNDSNSEIFLYDGAKLIQVTNTSPGDISNRATHGNFQPSISDDGRFIAFSSNRNLAGLNADGNSEIFVYDTVGLSFTQITNSSGIVGFTDPKIASGNETVAYIRDTGTTPSTNRDLLIQNRASFGVLVLATNVPALSLTYGRALSDDGQRVVWSAETAPDESQVFLWDGRNSITRQITALGARSTDVPLHPSVSGDGSRISFATRRPVLPGNGDNSIEVYTYEISSGTFSRVTNAPGTADGFDGSRREVEVISSLNDDGSLIAFNFPRVLSGAVANTDFVNNSEIYVTGTTPRPAFGDLTILNGASFGHEPATTEAVAPDSVAVARGNSLAFRSEQSQPQNGSFPNTVAGTTVTVNGRSAQIFFVSPTQVNFHVPAATELGTAEVIVTNSDGFQSRGTIQVLRAAPGIFTKTGDGLGRGMILNADTLVEQDSYDPSSGNLRLIIFATGVRNGSPVTVTAGGRALTVESIATSPNMPGLDEVHVLVPADLRGAGKVDLVIRADTRDSNPVEITFGGDSTRDILINEFLADPPVGNAADPLVGDANHDGVRSGTDDEFVELVNTTTRDIDISGYQILTRGGSGSSDAIRHTFAPGTILRSCTAVVVFGGGNPDPNNSVFGGARIETASTVGLSLTNAGGVVTLRNQAGGIVNFVSYGGSTGLDADADQSLTRSPDLSARLIGHLSADGSAGRRFSPGTQVNGMPFPSCAPAVARVEVLPASATIDAGAQQQFTAKAYDAANNEIPGVIFAWQSSNTSVATIDQSGLATGISAGTTEIRATGRGIQSPPVMLTVNPVAPPNVVVNEVDSDQIGTDTAEFVELFDGGTGNTSLTRLVVVFYNGGNDQSYAAFDLDGFTTNSNGYFTLGSAAVAGVDLVFADGVMQNGPDAVAVYVGNAADFPNGTPVTTTDLIDALVYDTNDADDPGLLVLLNPSQPQINEDAGGNAEANSNQRCPNGSGGARNTSTYNQFAPTPDGANVCVVTTPVPTLSINNVSANEGNTGTTTFTFTVSLSSPAPAGGVTFDIATADNTATVADNDYVARSLTAQTIAAGAQTYQFTVTVNGDGTVEPNESFFVNVTNVTGATMTDGQGLGTIQNDDSPTLSINDVSASEGNNGTTTFTFTVTSSLPAPAGGIGFDIATADSTATVADNDYVAKTLTGQTIAAGITTYTFDVTVNGDLLVEPNETFFVNITNASGATVADGQGLGTIQNDDGALLVISQVYGGGNNSGALYRNDFVEIFNRGTTSVDFSITPHSIQYASVGSGFGSNKTDMTSGTIAPGQYFLIQESGGTTNGAPLPTPNAIGTIAMGNTAGKVALVVGTASLPALACPGDDGSTPFNPTDSAIADFVGYGNSASTSGHCYEGLGPAPAPSNTTADFRKAGGCTDTNDNAADFLVSAPFPRNTSSPLNNCVAGTAPNLTINDVTVVEGNSGTTTATFTVSLSAPAPSTDVSFDIATQDNTATAANSDYVAKTSTSQVIPAGQQTYTFTVNVNGDTAVEPNETFFVNVTNASGATVTDDQGAGTIQNDDVPGLSVNDVAISEGNDGTKLLTFSVSLSAPAPATVTFDIATQDNTATVANNDYVARALTSQTIAAGASTYSFDVTVNGDVTIESDETFFVNVTNVSGATVSDGQGQGTIQNDDSPSLTINDVSANETNSGTTIFTFTVTSSLPAPAGGITFDIATADGTAQDDNPTTEDNDYVARSLASQTIPATQTTYTFDVTVNGDTFVEPNETFVVNISNPTGATIGDPQGVGTILNDDLALVVISQIYGAGGNSGATFTHDFIEVFNRGGTTVNLAGWSAQYNAAADTDAWAVTALCPSGPCLLAPGQYFLIQQAQGAGGTTPLPTPDATDTTNLAAASGKVALLSHTTALTGACPADLGIADVVGYGGTATCFEGTAPAPAPANTTADFRKAGGCTDTNDNAADFLVATPTPRNTASPLNDCTAADLAITKTDSPDPVTTGSDVTYTITVTNNGPGAAQSVVVNDTLTGGGSITSCSSTAGGICGGTGNSRSITFTSLANGASAVITIIANATGTAGATITNTATVSASSTDPNVANNSAEEVTTIQAAPAAVDHVTVSPNPATINRGNTQQFTATAFDSGNQPIPGATFTWSSSDTNIASINSTGLATGVGIGTVTITATTDNGTGGTISGTAMLTVQVPLVINEILADVPLDSPGTTVVVEGDANRDGVRDSADDEFVELLNDSTASVDLSGVVITDATNAATSRFTFPNGTILAAGRAIVVFGGVAPPASDPAFGGALVLASPSTLSLNDTGDTVTVKLNVGGSDVQIAQVIYGGSGNPAAPSDQSLTRSSDAEIGSAGGGFVAHTAATNPAGRVFSPGTRADGTPFGSPAITRIEVLPATAAIAIGATQLFTGHAYSNVGGPELEVLNVSFIWDSSDPTKATVAPTTGQTTTATALAAGTSNVRARAGGQEGSAALTVNAPPPTLNIDDVTQAETNSGATTFTFHVVLSSPAPAGGVTFDIATADGTAEDDNPATEDNDYVARTVLGHTILEGASTYDFAVTVNGDAVIEPDETFFVNVTNITGATEGDVQGLGTIQNDDSSVVADLSVSKTVDTAAPVVGQGVVFTVTLSNGGPSTATGVQVTDLLPAGLVYVSSTVSQGTYDSGTGLWSIGAVNNAASATLTITARVQTQGAKTNTATITASGASDPNSTNNQSSVTFTPGLPLLVISQLYTVGGASAALYNRDYIEIFNRSTVPINLSGFSVQYAATATGTFTVIASLPAVTLQPRQYFLITAGTTNAAVGVNLPVPADVTGSNTNMTGSAGKVAIVFGTAALTSSNVNNPPLTVGNPSPGCPTNNTIVVDFIGYGTTAACYEGTTRAPDPTATNNSQSDFRANDGCTDTNDNGADFARANALPRNSSTTKLSCP